MSRTICFLFFFFTLCGGVFACDAKFSIEILNEIDQAIQKETQQINKIDPYCNSTNDVTLELYNERGISYFAKREYKLALADFDHILETKSSINQMRDLVVGTALWGRALCHACLDMDENTYEDFDMLESYFRDIFQTDCACDSEKKDPVSRAVSRKGFHARTMEVKFANPNEKISIEECNDRIRGCAKKLRLFIGPLIKDVAKRTIFFAFINALEDQGLYCCRHGTFWTSCVTPILEKLQNWNAFGIPADPYWD